MTYAVTVDAGRFNFDASVPSLLNLERGKTYIFNQNNVTNLDEFLFFSETENGWHSTGNSSDIGDANYLYQLGVEYYIDGTSVSLATYISQFNSASTRETRFTVPATAPRILYLFAYSTTNLGIRTVQDGYLLGDLVEDYIYDSTVGTLDAYNGKFDVTPEYPNGTYAYFMTEDSNGNPVYPYAIGPRMYGAPLFEGDTVPAIVSEYSLLEQSGDVVLDNAGRVSYIKMTSNGDNYFGPAKAKILGGEGTGALATPAVQTVTGLSLLNSGRSYQSAPTLIFEGGGGQGAQGAAKIDQNGKVTSIYRSCRSW